jgi:hypothetical protein
MDIKVGSTKEKFNWGNCIHIIKRTKKLNQVLSLLLFFILLTAGIVSASNPSQPTSIIVDSNSTNSYPNGTVLNYTRGYIYFLTINESQLTQKWVGYVGNINGEFALQDADADALYDWDIATITGELYATKEGPLGAAPNYDLSNRFAGGVPVWSNLTCANSTQLSTEEVLYNHTSTDEDSYSSTFKTTGFTNPGFYAGENEVADNDCYGGCTACSGAHLNQNNADEPDGGNWSQVVLTDGTSQPESAAQNNLMRFDIIYAAILENDSVGFDGNTYDFQIMLPQSGLQGSQPNVAFYFYVELI